MHGTLSPTSNDNLSGVLYIYIIYKNLITCKLASRDGARSASSPPLPSSLLASVYVAL
jgi:hypothetical protein